MDYDIRLNSSNPTTYGWTLASIPAITHSTVNRDRFSIPARDGELLGSEIWRGNAFVTCVFHTRVGWDAWHDQYGHTTIDDRYNDLMYLIWEAKYLHILTKNTSNHSNWDKAGYYEVLGYNVTEEVRTGNDYMRITVQFEVYPFKFAEITTINPEYTTALSIENSLDESQPLYMLTRGASSSAGNFTLNMTGNFSGSRTISGQFPANVTEIYLDTRRQVSYYISSNVKHEITNITGDYRQLRIPAHTQIVLAYTGATGLRTYTRFGVKI